MNRPHLSPTVPLLILGLLAAGGAEAWTKETHVEIARLAAKIAPPDLLRQIKRNEKAFVAGLATSWAEHGKSRQPSSRKGAEMLAQVRTGTKATVAAIESHRPFSEVVRYLGRLAVYAADANNPLLHSAADPEEGSYHDELRSLHRERTAEIPGGFLRRGPRRSHAARPVRTPLRDGATQHRALSDDRTRVSPDRNRRRRSPV